MIEKEPSLGYRIVAWLLGFNKNTVQRIFRIKGWQVRKRPIGMRPRIEAVPSVATALNERWSTDLTHVWCGQGSASQPGGDHQLLHTRGSRLVIIGQCQQQDSGGRAGGSADLSAGGGARGAIFPFL